MWKTQVYGSGTTVVVSDDPSSPWLYVYADSGTSEDRYMQDRQRMCDSLAGFLNGGIRPVWLLDFELKNAECAVSLSGASITATGPMYDRDQPKLHWDTVMTPEAVKAREALIARLFSRTGP